MTLTLSILYFQFFLQKQTMYVSYWTAWYNGRIPKHNILYKYLDSMTHARIQIKNLMKKWCNGSFYDQTDDGVSMGSLLAPVLVNRFMGHHEMKWLDTFPSEILFYRRYVDDTLFVPYRVWCLTIFWFHQLLLSQHTIHNGSRIRP